VICAKCEKEIEPDYSMLGNVLDLHCDSDLDL
jgi:hypothetical protein